VDIANELTAHWAFESFVPWGETGVVNAPHNFHVVLELSGCEGGVSAMVVKICAISFGYSEEVTMFGGVVEEVMVDANMCFVHLFSGWCILGF
jgi:hypothetical protein